VNDQFHAVGKFVEVSVNCTASGAVPVVEFAENEATGANITPEYVNWSADPVAEVPEGVVTVTSTVPAPADAGEVTVICVPETESMVARFVPNATDDVPIKLEPVMVTVSPPAVLPVFGETEVTVGGGFEYVNWSAGTIADVPEGVVTVTSTVPALATAGEVTVSWLLDPEILVARFVPNLTHSVPIK
jgi:hypothetical protein